MSKIPSASEILLEFLTKSTGEYITTIYYQLFSTLSNEDLDKDLKWIKSLYDGTDDYFKESSKLDWFAIWHKQIRQTDFFRDCYKRKQSPILNDAERKEFKFLRHLVYKENYNKRDEDGYFTNEYMRYLDLHTKNKQEILEDSINGKLDSILWNTICLDKDNFLLQIFKRVFDEMDYYKI
jgi:hypothetical protein